MIVIGGRERPLRNGKMRLKKWRVWEFDFLEFHKFLVLYARAKAARARAALVVKDKRDHLESFHVEHPGTELLHISPRLAKAKGQVAELLGHMTLVVESREEFGQFGCWQEPVSEVVVGEEDGIAVEVEVRAEQRDEGPVVILIGIESQACELEDLLVRVGDLDGDG